MSGPSDHELVERLQSGDGSAFAELVTRHERRIYNLAYRMLGGAQDAEDATQDAFLAAYRRIGTFRGEAAFSTWLYRVAVNVCYDTLRAGARVPDPVETLPERPDDGRDPADTAQAVTDVQRALSRVPEEFRAVLILHDMHDLGFEQIAEALEVPVGTVKSRLHRGRAAMGALLAGTSAAAPSSEGTT